MSAITLDTRLDQVLGKAAGPLAEHLDLRTVRDLLWHVPRDYYSRGQHSSASGMQVGDHVTFVATVTTGSWIPANPHSKMAQRGGKGAKGRYVAQLALERGSIEAVFWNQIWLQHRLPSGSKGLFSGVIKTFRGKLQLSAAKVVPFGRSTDHPTASAGSEAPDDVYIDPDTWADRQMPIYPTVAAVDSWKIQRATEYVLAHLDHVHDILSPEEQAELDVVSIGEAFRRKHLPRDDADRAVADRRLKLQEALLMMLLLHSERALVDRQPADPRPLRPGGALAAFDDQLPFELTCAQRAAGEVIASELADERPMHRLLQGDVGSGKTVVALRAMLQVAATGGQCALLAPTEVLAHQHYRSLLTLLGDLGIAGQLGSHPDAVKVVVLSAGMPAAARKQAMLDIASGTADIVIGTHALLEPKVSFADLAFVVIDEQHRFGVDQRDALRRKSEGRSTPHTLVMTATPIPRTIALTAFGDLETLVLDELPPGRTPIATTVVPVAERPGWVDRVWARLREEVAAGRQAFVVCPRIGLDDPEPDADPGADDGEARRPAAAVLDVAERLAADQLAGLRVVALHGQQHPDEKDAIMQAFASGDIDVLVATTVIEVGVDVPNATVMAVLDADRFGLATLHQLRGRVGRGSNQAVCLLLTEAAPGSHSRRRLEVLEQTTDGFEIAEHDLELRREGDVLGVAQSGRRTRLRALLITRDRDVIEDADRLARRIVAEDPTLRRPHLSAEVEWMRTGTIDYLQKS